MVKIRTFYSPGEMDYEKNSGVSAVTDEVYEELSEMIPRIIRGEIKPLSSRYAYDFTDKDAKNDDIFDLDSGDDLEDLTDIDFALPGVSGSEPQNQADADFVATPKAEVETKEMSEGRDNAPNDSPKETL